MSSMLQELADKFEKRMVEEREARSESVEMLKDCVEKLMEELCQVALIVTGKREADEDPSRQRENIAKRLGILFREVRIRLGKWKGDDESWETREEMFAGIKKELGLQNSEDGVQDGSLDTPPPQTQTVPGQSSDAPDALSSLPRCSGQGEQEEETNGGDQSSDVRGDSMLGGAADARLGPPYIRLRRLDPAILLAKHVREEEKTVASRGGRATSAHGKHHSTRNQQGESRPKVGGSRQGKKSRGSLEVPDPRQEQNQKFACPTCTKAYTLRRQLNRHMEIRHSFTTSRPIQCPQCPTRFKFRSELTRHMVVHSDRKPFKCPKCPTRFKRSGNVKAHVLYVHSNRRPFKCRICGAGFKYNYELTLHLRVHTGERPYSCDICDKTFTILSNLKTHARTHLGEEGKIHQCPFCNMKFVTLSNCRDHQQRRHKSELESEAKRNEGRHSSGPN